MIEGTSFFYNFFLIQHNYHIIICNCCQLMCNRKNIVEPVIFVLITLWIISSVWVSQLDEISSKTSNFVFLRIAIDKHINCFCSALNYSPSLANSSHSPSLGSNLSYKTINYPSCQAFPLNNFLVPSRLTSPRAFQICISLSVSTL